MACLISQQIILHLYLIITCTVLYPEIIATRHEENLTEVSSACHHGSFRPLFIMVEMAKSMTGDVFLQTEQRTELSYFELHPSSLFLFYFNCVSQWHKVTFLC